NSLGPTSYPWLMIGTIKPRREILTDDRDDLRSGLEHARDSTRSRIVSDFSQLFFRFFRQGVKQDPRLLIYGGNRSDHRRVQNGSQPFAKLLTLLLTRTCDFILPSALAGL